MADSTQYAVRDYLRTIRYEALKLFRVYDNLNRVIAQYEAPLTAKTGDLCMKTQYSYVSTSSRVEKMKESLDSWDSSWDLP